MNLSGENFISMTKNYHARHMVDAVFVPETRRLEIETPLADTAAVLVSKGLAVSIVNTLAINALNVPGLVERPVQPELFFDCYSPHSKVRVEQAITGEVLRCLG